LHLGDITYRARKKTGDQVAATFDNLITELSPVAITVSPHVCEHFAETLHKAPNRPFTPSR
jgi:hypothetical protein